MKVNKLLVCLIIVSFLNALLIDAKCRSCKKIARKYFKEQKKVCKDDYRSRAGQNSTIYSLKYCISVQKSIMWEAYDSCLLNNCEPSVTPEDQPGNDAPVQFNNQTVDWVLGGVGDSCDVVCGRKGLTCSLAPMNEVNNEERTLYVTSVTWEANNIPCSSPYSFNGIDNENYYPAYREFQGLLQKKVYGVSQSASTCEGQSQGFQRLCCCGDFCPWAASCTYEF
jgi:hypothetical protein